MQRKFSLQLLVLGTALAALVVFLGLGAPIWLEERVVVIQTAGQPTVGSKDAGVELVVFEDFRCGTCQLFNEEIYPKLERYVKGGQVKYVVIPLGFLDGSKPYGNAALAVYKIAPERFLDYVRALFQSEAPIGSEEMVFVELGRRVGGIDLSKLGECIRTSCYYGELDQNYERAVALLGKRFGAPAVFVNGVQTPPVNLQAIEGYINRALKVEK